jgi:aminoglycoside phosphotransferase (APT) family kinase protein
VSDSAQVRPDERFDTAAVEEYLSRNWPAFSGPLSVEQFPSGHSNLTYLLKTPAGEYVLRRPPFGSTVKSAHDMGREFRVLSKLEGVYAAAPKPFLYCDDQTIIGAPFYVMERLRGIVVRKSLPSGWTPDLCRRVAGSFVDQFALLHATDLERTGLLEIGKPEGYVARQVDGWIRRFHDAQTDDVPAMDDLTRWLEEHRPESSAAALVHNDYKLDNVVLDEADPARIAGVLDWEMATVGDPLLDLGTTLSYWVNAGDPEEMRALGFGPTYAEGFPTRREIGERYAERSGRDIAKLPYCYCFGLFKVAAIVQQIYFRYRKGLTRDQRFAAFGEVVRALLRQAARAADRLEL